LARSIWCDPKLSLLSDLESLVGGRAHLNGQASLATRTVPLAFAQPALLAAMLGPIAGHLVIGLCALHHRGVKLPAFGTVVSTVVNLTNITAIVLGDAGDLEKASTAPHPDLRVCNRRL
jgi:hypothetical protein